MTPEVPKRLTPTRETFREIYLKSGNLCAFPGCNELLMNSDGVFIGQICHIEGAEPGGERYNPEMTNEQRRSAGNLMLMCYAHHQVTNDVGSFPVSVLREMKAAHEKRFAGQDRQVKENLLKLKWGTVFGTGAVVGTGLGLLLAASSQPRSAQSSDIGRLRRQLVDRLRYVPTGTVYSYTASSIHKDVGEQFLGVFELAGWEVIRLTDPPRVSLESKPDYTRAMLFLFVVASSDQRDNTAKAIHGLFRSCGFVPSLDKPESIRTDGQEQLTFIVPVISR